MTMDAMLDASFVVPAVLFTVLAVILASSLLRKKRDPAPKCDSRRVHEAAGDRVPPGDEIREVEEVAAEAVSGDGEEEPAVEDVGALREEPHGGQGTILKPVSAPTWKEEPSAEPMLAPVLESSPPPETEKEANAEATHTATSGTVPPSQPEPDPVCEPIVTATPEPDLLSEPTASASYESQTLTPQSTFEPCPEQIPESSQLCLQETAAESFLMKELTMKTAPPSSQEEEEGLKYAPGKLRTSQFEKLMTKEELEEEQRVQKEQLAAIFQLLRDNKETFGEVTEADVEEQLKLYSI